MMIKALTTRRVTERKREMTKFGLRQGSQPEYDYEQFPMAMIKRPPQSTAERVTQIFILVPFPIHSTLSSSPQIRLCSQVIF